MVDRDLAADGAPRTKVLAAAVRLLDLGFFRIGGEQYAEEHETFGVATLRRDHVSLRNHEMVFDYPAKGIDSAHGDGGRSGHISFAVDPQASARWQRQPAGLQRPGAVGGHGSVEVNAYIRQSSAGDFSAKDFRTWSATVLGAVELAKAAQAGSGSKSAPERASRQAVKVVSEYLGNTPAVCRSSYIDPRIFDRYAGGETIAPTLKRLGADVDISDETVRPRVEAAVVHLIDDGVTSAAT